MIKKRLYKIKERLYIEAKYLKEYGFGIGQPIKYDVDKENKRITVVAATSHSKKRVAQTTQKTGKTVPVIDIKANDVKDFFAKHNNIEVEIHKGKIIFSVLEEVISLPIDNIVSLDEARNTKQSFERKRYSVSVNEFAKVSGYEQMSIFDIFQMDKEEKKGSGDGPGSTTLKEKAIKMLSLFSGSGSLDKAFLDEKYDIVFANDRFEKKALRDYHIQTYRENIGNHIVMQDVLTLEEKDIPEVDFVAAGVPCVTFSRLNTVNNFRDDESLFHPIVEKTLNIIKWSKAKSFLIENVESFLTVKKGAMLKRIKERLHDFNIVEKVIDATSLGSAQKRKRAFILGIKNGDPNLDIPHLAEYRTVADAFKDIDTAPQQDIYFEPTEKMMERIIHIPQGGNITNVPMHLRAPNKKYTNYCQRLEENGQSPTITHIQDDAFIHPTLNRYLTVREAARLFSLPDDFTFIGSRTSIFEMLKNAVDYKVSKYLAKIIKKQLLPVLT
ncbi:DNA cytosine methyltransferase [[Brevibacterium] frigoritolerans]|nr:DNA cytosine methyltransferase [Peribacillus frigoritolerans]